MLLSSLVTHMADDWSITIAGPTGARRIWITVLLPQK